MNTVFENHASSSSTFAQPPSPAIYDPDDVGSGSPIMKPVAPRMIPSPSPEPTIPVPDIGPDGVRHKEKNGASMGDGILVQFMANGEHQDVLQQVAREPLASSDDGVHSVGGVGVTILRGKDREEIEEWKSSLSEGEWNTSRETQAGAEKKMAAHMEKDVEDIAALAAKAFRRTEQSPSPKNRHFNGSHDSATMHAITGEPMEDVKQSVPSITVNSTRSKPTPDLSSSSEMQIPPTPGAFPPIQHLSDPTLPNGTNSVTLPSISHQLGDIINFPKTPRDIANFPQSPPPPPPQRFRWHRSSPRSPIVYRALPSPRQNSVHPSRRRPPRAEGATLYSNGLPYPSPSDYNSSNAETPSDQSPPALGFVNISIDVLTNAQIGGYQCTFAGCTAQPFQTQYLSNPYANVYSQNRPYYCSVEGCSRSESGKGFKRKNERIRHGLAHDSPGYVCPFCPDKRLKYPRPDNMHNHASHND